MKILIVTKDEIQKNDLTVDTCISIASFADVTIEKPEIDRSGLVLYDHDISNFDLVIFDTGSEIIGTEKNHRIIVLKKVDLNWLSIMTCFSIWRVMR